MNNQTFAEYLNVQQVKGMGRPCRSPAVRGKSRCRIHGGSKGSGGQHNNQNAIKHGYTTKEAKAQREQVRAQIKLWKKFEEEFD